MSRIKNELNFCWELTDVGLCLPLTGFYFRWWCSTSFYYCTILVEVTLPPPHLQSSIVSQSDLVSFTWLHIFVDIFMLAFPFLFCFNLFFFPALPLCFHAFWQTAADCWPDRPCGCLTCCTKRRAVSSVCIYNRALVFCLLTSLSTQTNGRGHTPGWTFHHVVFSVPAPLSSQIIEERVELCKQTTKQVCFHLSELTG